MSKPKWRGILLHHSATPDGPLQDTDAIDRNHREVRGWSQIGYNWCVERHGDSYVQVAGRSEDLQGAHCPGRNDIDLGVCVIGDFTIFPPTFEQLSVTAQLCADLCRRHDISPMAIRTHRTFRATECPGLVFTDAHVFVLRQEVARLLKLKPRS